jgi:hypothetical protein
MKARIWLCTLVALTALGGCDKIKDLAGNKDDSASDEGGSKKKGKKKKKKPEDEDEGGGLLGKAGDKPAGEGAVEAVSCGEPSVIPPIPATKSNPPTVSEWGRACDVNTQGAGSQPSDCTMKVMREWLQVTCRAEITGYENLTDFGSEGADYFKQIQIGKMASFVVRLKKGRNQKVRICKRDGRASLFVSWPPSKDNPSIVALGIGPGCERNASFKTN